MRDPHNGGMCFNGRMCLNLRSSTFLAVEKASASAFSAAKNVELLGFYPIYNPVLLSNVNFHPLEAVSRYNDSYLFNLGPNISKF